MATGRCLCGAVRYTIGGTPRDVLVCHCAECRRWHGHLCAMTAVAREDLVIDGAAQLRWFTSATGDAGARRGFCGRCGSSLLWDAPGRATISISAGTLDGASGLRTMGHIYVSQTGDYYELAADGTPQHATGS